MGDDRASAVTSQLGASRPVTWDDFVGSWTDEMGFVYEFSLNADEVSATLTRSVPRHGLCQESCSSGGTKQRWTSLARLSTTGLTWGTPTDPLMIVDVLETMSGRALRWFLPPSFEQRSKLERVTRASVDLPLSAVPVMIWTQSAEERVATSTVGSPPPRAPPPRAPPELTDFLERRRKAMLAAFRESYRLQRRLDQTGE
jgi:hypothetical protein